MRVLIVLLVSAIVAFAGAPLQHEREIKELRENQNVHSAKVVKKQNPNKFLVMITNLQGFNATVIDSANMIVEFPNQRKTYISRFDMPTIVINNNFERVTILPVGER